MQELPVAESPEHTDAGQAAVACRRQVHIAVAHIDGSLLPYSQLAQGFIHGVGGRLPADALCFMLAYGDLYFREKVAHQFLSCRHHLVAHHRHATTAPLQFAQRVADAVVGTGGVERVFHIVTAEDGKDFLELRMVGPVGYRPFHESSHPIAHKAPDVVQAVLGHSELSQGIVHAGSQVAQGVQERAVQVEDIGAVCLGRVCCCFIHSHLPRH